MHDASPYNSRKTEAQKRAIEDEKWGSAQREGDSSKDWKKDEKLYRLYMCYNIHNLRYINLMP